MAAHSTFDICVEPIELYKLLNIAKLADGGGEAKTMISEGHVLVNKEVVVQKRKKIRRGDVVECNGTAIEVAFNPSQKSDEFISNVVSATKSSKKKKRAKSKARSLAAEASTDTVKKR